MLRHIFEDLKLSSLGVTRGLLSLYPRYDGPANRRKGNSELGVILKEAAEQLGNSSRSLAACRIDFEFTRVQEKLMPLHNTAELKAGPPVILSPKSTMSKLRPTNSRTSNMTHRLSIGRSTTSLPSTATPSRTSPPSAPRGSRLKSRC